jgi:hypothetical protein
MQVGSFFFFLFFSLLSLLLVLLDRPTDLLADHPSQTVSVVGEAWSGIGEMSHDPGRPSDMIPQGSNGAAALNQTGRIQEETGPERGPKREEEEKEKKKTASASACRACIKASAARKLE